MPTHFHTISNASYNVIKQVIQVSQPTDNPLLVGILVSIDNSLNKIRYTKLLFENTASGVNYSHQVIASDNIISNDAALINPPINFGENRSQFTVVLFSVSSLLSLFANNSNLMISSVIVENNDFYYNIDSRLGYHHSNSLKIESDASMMTPSSTSYPNFSIGAHCPPGWPRGEFTSEPLYKVGKSIKNLSSPEIISIMKQINTAFLGWYEKSKDKFR